MQPTSTIHPADPRRGVFAQRLTLHAGASRLLDDASFAVTGGRQVALVGRNGSGKSTLLLTIHALAAGTPAPEGVSTEGSLSVSPGLRAGYLPQNPQVAEPGPVADYLQRHGGAAARAWAEQERLSAELAAGRSDEATLIAYGEALEEMERSGGWSHAARRQEVLRGLGLDPALLERPLQTLSGGEATRVALAALLLAEPELLLLDEPSNTLDAGARDYLAGWLERSASGVLLVSHDRDLLERATEILEIEEGTGRLTAFGGGLEAFERDREAALQGRRQDYEEQVRERARLNRSATLLADRAQSFQSRSQNDFYRRRGAKVARAAVAQSHRIERELQTLDEPDLPSQPRFTVGAPALAEGTLLRLQRVRLQVGNRVLADGIDLAVAAGERIAVVGPNGSGKTTLLGVLAGVTPAAGEVWRSPAARVATLPQLIGAPGPRLSVLDLVSAQVELGRDELRALLGKVLFGDVARLRAADQSEGELRRALLAGVLAQGPELLLLDEPTNHLDLATVALLEDALDEFAGAVVAVSHDRRFLERLRPGRALDTGAARSWTEPGPASG